jgi:hypothetical protein
LFWQLAGLVHVPQRPDVEPQTLVTVPHCAPPQPGVGHVHVSLALQFSPGGQLDGQLTLPPQPLGAWLQKPLHGLEIGWQHWPPSQRPPSAQ